MIKLISRKTKQKEINKKIKMNLLIYYKTIVN